MEEKALSNVHPDFYRSGVQGVVKDKPWESPNLLGLTVLQIIVAKKLLLTAEII